MCYAIPGKVISISSKSVEIEYFGEIRKAHNEFDDLVLGDYVYAQGGYIIKKIPREEAESILSVWKETFFELQEVDVQLSRLDIENKGLDKRFCTILDKSLEGRAPSKEELLYLLQSDNPAHLDYFFKSANFLRQKHLKNSCCVHGILEISNYCRQSCAYCGISLHNDSVHRYRMTNDEVVDAAYEAIERYGFKALVLQSGEDPSYTIDDLVYIVKTIKERAAVLLFISFGEIGIEGLNKLFKAGARGLLMRFETSNRVLYEQLHPGCSIDTRLNHLREAYKMGYLIITGGLIGLPGQTLEDSVNDIFLTKGLNAEMYSFGPFIPHVKTPLAHHTAVTDSHVLKILAGARLIDPENAKILVTTAFETISADARKNGLLAGANSVMLNVTPVEYRNRYDIYPNRFHNKELISEQITETLALLGSLGRAPTDLGAS